MNDFTSLVNIIAQGMLELMKQHGFLVGGLAVLGFVAILGAIFSQVFKILRYLFYIFIAMPVIILVGIFHRKDRKKRIKELGEMRAFVKDNPDRIKKIVYYILLMIFLLLVMLLILWFIINFFKPLFEFNQMSKEFLKNYTINYTQLNNTIEGNISVINVTNLSK